MTPFDSVVLGIVEGLTEFLPISSTAHLIITGKLLGIPETDFFKSFIIIIQLGAILAVLYLYAQKIFKSRTLWKKVLVAWIPTAGIGFLLYQLVKDVLLENLSTIALAMIVGGIVIILFEYFSTDKKKGVEMVEDISYKKSFLVGLIQTLAIIPGVSRSGATILGGMGLGISRTAIIEFSFLLAIPTIVAASGYDILQSEVLINKEHLFELVLGFVVAFVSAYIAIRFLMRFIQHHSFMVFGVYRIIAGAGILFFLI